MSYNNCNECPHYKKDSCPLSKFSQKQREQFCPSLKLRIREYDDSHVDLMAQRLLDRLDAIMNTQTQQPQRQEMDYSRNDTKEIVNSMKPFNN